MMSHHEFRDITDEVLTIDCSVHIGPDEPQLYQRPTLQVTTTQR